jgi:hypothetical protein
VFESLEDTSRLGKDYEGTLEIIAPKSYKRPVTIQETVHEKILFLAKDMDRNQLYKLAWDLLQILEQRSTR